MGLQHTEAGRPVAQPNPTTRPFFDAAREGRLMLQRCPRDGFFFYPRSHCPRCLGTDWGWEQTSGRGTVHSFTIDRIGHAPGLGDQVPYAIAIVELDEGPRMTARLVECDVADVEIGQAVEARFEALLDAAVVHFAPAS